MPARKKSPSSMLTSISKRPSSSAKNKIKKLTNLSNLKTNAQREFNVLTSKFSELSIKTEARRKEEREARDKIVKAWRSIRMPDNIYTKTPEFKAKRKKLENKMARELVNADNNISQILKNTNKKVTQITREMGYQALNKP